MEELSEVGDRGLVGEAMVRRGCILNIPWMHLLKEEENT